MPNEVEPSFLDSTTGHVNRDVITCINRVAYAPIWLAIGGHSTIGAIVGSLDVKPIDSFDLGARIDKQSWSYSGTLPRSDLYGFAAMSSMIVGGNNSRCRDRDNALAAKKCYILVYDRTSGTTVCSAQMPAVLNRPRFRHATVTVGDDAIVVGGDDSLATVGSIEVLRGNRWTCHSLPDMLSLAEHACVPMSRAALMTIGGWEMGSVRGLVVSERVRSTNIDLISMQVTQCAEFGRSDYLGCRASAFGGGVVYATQCASTKRYDARSDAWNGVADPPIELCGAAHVKLELESFALIGSQCIVYDTRADMWWFEDRWALNRSEHTVVAV